MTGRFIIAVLLACCVGNATQVASVFRTPRGVTIPAATVSCFDTLNRQAFFSLNGDLCRISTGKGVTGRYNTVLGEGMVRPWIRGIESSSYRNYREEFLYFLLGFMRTKCVISMNHFSMFDRISYDKLSPELREFLFPQIREIEKRGATEDVAQRYSIMCAFDISWNESIRFMGKIAKEGAFSHEYSLEEALFIAHMHTKAPSAIERWLKGNKYHEEQLTYTACLAASITKILTTDGRLPSSFSLDKPTITTESRESLVNSNVKKLVNAYLGDQQ